MEKYKRVIQWSEDDKCYIVIVPELPGCMSDGKTIEEALKNTNIIISEWIETAINDGLEIPEPELYK